MDGDPGILASAVRRWAARVLPGDDRAADAAVDAALEALGGGASMSEACAVARQLVRSWSMHPARCRQSAGFRAAS